MMYMYVSKMNKDSKIKTFYSLMKIKIQKRDNEEMEKNDEEELR